MSRAAGGGRDFSQSQAAVQPARRTGALQKSAARLTDNITRPEDGTVLIASPLCLYLRRAAHTGTPRPSRTPGEMRLLVGVWLPKSNRLHRSPGCLLRPSVDSASPVSADALPGALLPGVPPVSMVAFRTADLRVRSGMRLSGRPGAMFVSRSGTAGAGVAAGTLVTFCLPVVSVPAVVRRDGTVLAGEPAGSSLSTTAIPADGRAPHRALRRRCRYLRSPPLPPPPTRTSSSPSSPASASNCGHPRPAKASDAEGSGRGSRRGRPRADATARTDRSQRYRPSRPVPGAGYRPAPVSRSPRR